MKPERKQLIEGTQPNRRKTLFGRGLVIGAVVALAGCIQEPSSAVVGLLEGSGAGHLRSASTESIAKWLGKHPDLLPKTEALCKEVRPAAPATWGDMTEGRVCQASAQVAFFQFIPRDGDHRTFGAGTK